MGKEYICDTCKKIKCFTEMASYFGGHPRILKSCDACREKKKEELYIKHVLKRHKLFFYDNYFCSVFPFNINEL